MNPAKVMYLDDEEILLDMYTELIRSWGHEVDTFIDPKMALLELKSRKTQYRVILVDYLMPKMSGVKFIELLKENDFFNIQHVVLFSSMVWSGRVQEELRSALGQYHSKAVCMSKDILGHEKLKEYLDQALSKD